jgi:hypothetical protein
MVKGEQIKTQVQQHWSGEADLTARHDALSADLMAIHNDYVTAQNTCAAVLAAVSGGDVHTVSQPAQTDQRTGNWIDDWLWDAGTFLGIDHNEDHPWGKETVPYRPNGDLGLLQGVGAGAVELLDGVWSMTFTGNQAKRDQAWGGVNALNAAAWTLAATPLSAFDQNKQNREAPEVKKALDLFGSMGPAFVYADEADTNANWAGGGATFNIGTVLLSRGASAPLQGGFPRQQGRPCRGKAKHRHEGQRQAGRPFRSLGQHCQRARGGRDVPVQAGVPGPESLGHCHAGNDCQGLGQHDQSACRSFHCSGHCEVRDSGESGRGQAWGRFWTRRDRGGRSCCG